MFFGWNTNGCGCCNSCCNYGCYNATSAQTNTSNTTSGCCVNSYDNSSANTTSGWGCSSCRTNYNRCRSGCFNQTNARSACNCNCGLCQWLRSLFCCNYYSAQTNASTQTNSSCRCGYYNG